MSTHNIGFYEDLTKIIFELSSNMHLISSAVVETQRCIGPGCYGNSNECPQCCYGGLTIIILQ